MRKFYLLASISIILSTFAYSADELGKRDGYLTPAQLQVGTTSNEIRKVRCREDGVQLFDGSCSTMPSTQSGKWYVTITSYPTHFDVSESTVVAIEYGKYGLSISSGASGIITGATSATITITDKVSAWSFAYTDETNPTNFCTITPNIYGTPIYLSDGQAQSTKLTFPKAVTLTLANLKAEATMQYVIDILK